VILALWAGRKVGRVSWVLQMSRSFIDRGSAVRSDSARADLGEWRAVAR
jgi:hypothetical protein